MARQHPGLNVVGVGTQDTLNDAKGFVNRAVMRKVKMLWDATGQSWNYWGVPGQPAGLLVNASGVIVKTWTGELDKNAVLAAAGKV